MDELEKAYWAGIVDGEGCILIKKEMGKKYRATPAYRLEVSVSNTKPKVILDLIKYGASINITTYETNKPRYMAFLESLMARDFLREIAPYLRIKQTACEIALSFQQLLDLHHSGKKLTREEVNKREVLYKRLQWEKDRIPDVNEVRQAIKVIPKMESKYIHPWVPDEDEILRHFIPDINKIGTILKRSRAAIRQRIRRLGLGGTLPYYWHGDEDRVVIDHAPNWAQIVTILKGRSIAAIINRAYILGCTTRAGGHHKYWLPREDRLLTELYSKGQRPNEIASHLRRTEWAVRLRVSRLRLPQVANL